MINKTEFVNLLRALSQAFDKLSDAEFEKVLEGKTRLEFTESEQKKSKAKISENSKLSEDEFDLIISHLQECKSREEVREVLRRDSRTSLKDNLEKLAKQLRIHVNKHDKREIIEDKIVENVIGVKLRSEATLGTNLKGSGTTPQNDS